ncbi:MAG TPA: N-acetylgalactosamine 6-sulfate sulfatase [Planctomycetaceae bacterium]|nr:N-acetylgalactosamine 6-sulfate sulfatase [Planctomycetaceae bacterium]
MNQSSLKIGPQRLFVAATTLAALTTYTLSNRTIAAESTRLENERPHIILVMTDDQGWGETSYNGHPRLKTPNLDKLADAGVRFDRFYAGGPVCSPTRASVLTGRNHNRCGVPSHGHALRLQEQTLARLLQRFGYVTGHFGKWHLNGLRGPGVPVLSNDSHHPGKFGFEAWLSVTNFFDKDPILGRMGLQEEYQGDSSEVIVGQAINFIEAACALERPSFTVVWYGTPHDPFIALPADAEKFADLDERSRQHYGELTAMDRSIGQLQAALNRLEITEDTLIWFCSDNGGLGRITPGTVGPLRGLKGTLYEGGLRVPGILHWPAKFQANRLRNYPAGVVDICPTICSLLGLPTDSLTSPQDGISLVPAIKGLESLRPSPLCFRYQGHTAVIDNNMKLIDFQGKQRRIEMYDLSVDEAEQNNLADVATAHKARLLGIAQAFTSSVKRSIAGLDYPGGKLLDENPQPSFWMTHPRYESFLDAWRTRPEYAARIEKAELDRQTPKPSKEN